MAFALSARSLKELEGVHPDLVRVVHHAIKITSQDFMVIDGLRTAEEQAEHFRKGTSKLDGVTKKSRHQSGHAVDLVPVINGKPVWDWELIYPVADAMKAAGIACAVPIRWGGTWMNIIGATAANLTAKQLHGAHKGWDGPHYELPASAYPVLPQVVTAPKPSPVPDAIAIEAIAPVHSVVVPDGKRRGLLARLFR